MGPAVRALPAGSAGPSAGAHPGRLPDLVPGHAGGRMIGIDLGTATCAGCVLHDGRPVVVPNAEGVRMTPGVVAFAKNGGILVGEAARRQAVTNPGRTVRSVTCRLGTGWSVDIDGERYLTQQILAFLLSDLVRGAEAHLGEAVGSAVISVPVTAGYPLRRAAAEAAAIAGLRAELLISGPTLTGLAYAHDKGDREQTILVFDLGGGTLDVSVLELGDGVVDVKSTAGDPGLGGDDWDQRIIDHLVRTFQGRHGVDLGTDRTALERLREAAEKARIELSQSTQTSITLPHLTTSAEGPLHLDVTLTRAEFQRMTQDLIDRGRIPFRQAVKDAGIKASRIDHVVLVGGCTRMPAVVDLVRELTGGKEPNNQRQPRRGRRRRRRASGRCQDGGGQGRL